MTFEQYLVRWSQLHGQAQVTPIIQIWLRTTFTLAMPLKRIHPNVITVGGLLIAMVMVVMDRQGLLSGEVLAVLILSLGLIDSLDGIVATVTNRNSTFGAYLDSLVDRGLDVAIAILFLQHGAPMVGVLGVICLTLLHEYMRARALGLGMAGVGVITVAEKPTRIAVGVMFFIACGILPQHSDLLVSLAVWVWLGLAAVACIQLFVTIERNLTLAK